MSVFHRGCRVAQAVFSCTSEAWQSRVDADWQQARVDREVVADYKSMLSLFASDRMDRSAAEEAVHKAIRVIPQWRSQLRPSGTVPLQEVFLKVVRSRACALLRERKPQVRAR